MYCPRRVTLFVNCVSRRFIRLGVYQKHREGKSENSPGETHNALPMPRSPEGYIPTFQIENNQCMHVTTLCSYRESISETQIFYMGDPLGEM